MLMASSSCFLFQKEESQCLSSHKTRSYVARTPTLFEQVWDDLPNALTKFIRNVEARVFADIQSALPQEMNEGYGLPAEGRPDIPNA